MKRVVIIGAGSHGREVAEILRTAAQRANEVSVVGFVDDDRNLRDRTIDGLPVLGDWTWFEGMERSGIAVICASGFPRTRKQLVTRAAALGLSFVNAISGMAYLSPDASIGTGVVMYQNSTASRGVRIDDHAVINAGAILSHDTKIGRYATVNPGVHLGGNVSIEEGCTLGIGCNVIQQISIGRWTTVGSGAVVVRDLPEFVTAVGVPARIIKTGAPEHAGE